MNFHMNQRVKVIVAGWGDEPRRLNGGIIIPAGSIGTIVSEATHNDIGDVCYRVRIDGYKNPRRGYKIEAYNLRPLTKPDAPAAEQYNDLLDRLGVKNKQPVHDGVTLHEVS